MPVIRVYGKKKCQKCEAAKEKIKRLGFEYEAHDIDYHASHHDGWRTDCSVDVLSAVAQLGAPVPLIQIDGAYYGYPGAMKELKRLKKIRNAEEAPHD